MITTEIWLAVVSALVTAIGILGGLGYRDISRRLRATEQQNGKIISALLTLLTAKAGDVDYADAIAKAMHTLITNGIERTG